MEQRWGRQVKRGRREEQNKFKTEEPGCGCHQELSPSLVMEVEAQWHRGQLSQTATSDTSRAGSPWRAWRNIKQHNR